MINSVAGVQPEGGEYGTDPMPCLGEDAAMKARNPGNLFPCSFAGISKPSYNTSWMGLGDTVGLVGVTQISQLRLCALDF